MRLSHTFISVVDSFRVVGTSSSCVMWPHGVSGPRSRAESRCLDDARDLRFAAEQRLSL